MDPSFTVGQMSWPSPVLWAVCDFCGHFAVLELGKLLDLGKDLPVLKFEQRLRCRVCKMRKAKLTEERPRTGERECPKCGQPTWKPRPWM